MFVYPGVQAGMQAAMLQVMKRRNKAPDAVPWLQTCLSLRLVWVLGSAKGATDGTTRTTAPGPTFVVTRENLHTTRTTGLRCMLSNHYLVPNGIFVVEVHWQLIGLPNQTPEPYLVLPPDEVESLRSVGCGLNNDPRSRLKLRPFRSTTVSSPASRTPLPSKQH